MKHFTKLTACVVAMCMLLSLTACKEPPVPTTTTPTTTAPPTTAAPTTESPNEGLILYQAARAALEKQENVTMTVSVNETMQLPTEKIVTYTRQDITYLGRGTDGFEAKVMDTTGNEYGSIENLELYSGGKVYITSYEDHFMSELTGEEFTARYLPVILIDENLYTTCEYTADAKATNVTFSDFTATEGWIDPNATVISASGTATIDAAGTLTQYTYDLEYVLLGAKIHQEITVKLTTPKIDDVVEPADTADYLSLSDPDVIKLIYMCSFRTMTSTSITCTNVKQTASSAAAVSLRDTQSVDSYGTGENYMAQVEFGRQYTDLRTMETGSFTQKEIYRNKAYTAVNSDGVSVPNPSVTLQAMAEYVYGEAHASILGCGYMESCEVTDLGDVLLIECKGSDELGKLIEDEISFDLFQDSNYLDNLASAYETTQMDYYIAIDKYLCLPTAAGYTYNGSHTIDGAVYPLACEINSYIYLGSTESHSTITGNAIPDTDTTESPTPLFYHVTGPKGEEMWLLGTIHVGDARTGKLPQKIMDAFYSSDALAVECDPDKIEEETKDPAVAEEYANAYYYTDGSTTQDHISDAELYEYALDMMRASGNYNSMAPYLKCASWEITLSGFLTRMSYTYSSDKGVDRRLLDLAAKHNKPVRQVESNIFQLKMLTGWSDALAEVLLAGTLSTDLVTYTQEITELYELWCAGDETALKEYMKDDLSDMTAEEQALYQEYQKAMETDRNKQMAEVAIEYLESGETVFYAVGLAHVIADDGLVNALRDAGYTVELVTYE